MVMNTISIFKERLDDRQVQQTRRFLVPRGWSIWLGKTLISECEAEKWEEPIKTAFKAPEKNIPALVLLCCKLSIKTSYESRYDKTLKKEKIRMLLLRCSAEKL